MAKFILTDWMDSGLGNALCESCGVDPRMVSRIVLDLKVGEVGRVYYETFADASVLSVSIPAGIKIENG